MRGPNPALAVAATPVYLCMSLTPTHCRWSTGARVPTTLPPSTPDGRVINVPLEIAGTTYLVRTPRPRPAGGRLSFVL